MTNRHKILKDYSFSGKHINIHGQVKPWGIAFTLEVHRCRSGKNEIIPFKSVFLIKIFLSAFKFLGIGFLIA